MCGNRDWAWTIILIPESLNKANLFLDYNIQIMYSSQYQIKHLHGCHRSGNSQGKKFFKVREMSGNFIVQFQKMSILPPRKVFCFAPPLLPPLGNSSLFSYISSKNLAFKTPPPGISNDLPWGGYGFVSGTTHSGSGTIGILKKSQGKLKL